MALNHTALFNGGSPVESLWISLAYTFTGGLPVRTGKSVGTALPVLGGLVESALDRSRIRSQAGLELRCQC